MNYRKHYNSLISRARRRVASGYLERHHAIPKCMGGPDTKSNLVQLTPEEHYVAHLLLVKIYPGNQGLAFAAHMMTVGSNRQNRKGNKVYGWLRRKLSGKKSAESNLKRSESQRRAMDCRRGKTFEEIYGPERAAQIKEKRRGYTASAETRIKMSESLKGVAKSMEHRKKISHALTGLPRSVEHRKRLSLSGKRAAKRVRGKTYEEIYGSERAQEILRKKRAVRN